MAPTTLSPEENIENANNYLEANKQLKSLISINLNREIEWGSSVGALRFPNSKETYCETEKIQMGLPFMLEYLFDNGDMDGKYFLDPKIEVQLKDGPNYFNLVAFPFCSAVEKLIRISIRRRYIPYEDNLGFVKGRIDFAKNERINKGVHSSVYCNYDEFSADTKKNRAILWAIELLINSDIAFDTYNRELRAKLIRLKNILIESGVTLEPMDYSDLQGVVFGSANKHYQTAVLLAKIILRKNVYSSFHNSRYSKINKAVNFLVDENWVFECFMSRMMCECVNDKNNDFQKWEVQLQKRMTNLLDKQQGNSNFAIKPDVVLTDGQKKYAIDFKYKFNPSHGDFYQVLAYALATARGGELHQRCALWCGQNPPNLDQKRPVFSISKKIKEELKLDSDVDIYIFGSELPKEASSKENFTELVKSDIKEKLSTLLG